MGLLSCHPKIEPQNGGTKSFLEFSLKNDEFFNVGTILIGHKFNFINFATRRNKNKHCSPEIMTRGQHLWDT